MSEPALIHVMVDHIPVVYLMPTESPDPSAGQRVSRKVPVIWLPGFRGSKESVEPQLRALAGAGFIALSFDPWQHGARAVEPAQELRSRVLGNIRRHFWPILAHTAEEVTRVLDFAYHELGARGSAGIGGTSMGGDIAVAAAGIDQRIAAVAACVATADWLRPGSHEIPGAPDKYALRCYSRCNPLTNAANYAHLPAITFQSGALDAQVPPDGGERFVAALGGLFPVSGGRCEVRLHDGVGHEVTPCMLDEGVQWFTRWLEPWVAIGT